MKLFNEIKKEQGENISFKLKEIEKQASSLKKIQKKYPDCWFLSNDECFENHRLTTCYGYDYNSYDDVMDCFISTKPIKSSITDYVFMFDEDDDFEDYTIYYLCQRDVINDYNIYFNFLKLLKTSYNDDDEDEDDKIFVSFFKLKEESLSAEAKMAICKFYDSFSNTSLKKTKTAPKFILDYLLLK